MDQKSSSQALYLASPSALLHSHVHCVARSALTWRRLCHGISIEAVDVLQVAMIVGMVGVTYASVPLYRMFCQVHQLRSPAMHMALASSWSTAMLGHS